jgi:hypothetical protein
VPVTSYFPEISFGADDVEVDDGLPEPDGDGVGVELLELLSPPLLQAMPTAISSASTKIVVNI